MDAANVLDKSLSFLTMAFVYDAWGRVASRNVEVGKDTYAATYAYHYGVGSGVRS